MEMHFATVWESIADAIPELPAVTHGPVTRSWSEYDDRSARVAGAPVSYTHLRAHETERTIA